MYALKRFVIGLLLAGASLAASASELQLPAIFQVEAVLKQYIEGIRTGDVEMLRRIFDKNARLHGYIMGNEVNGTMDLFLKGVAERPSPAKSGEPFRATITGIEVTDTIARGTVVEESYFGMNFVDHFHLLKTAQGWVIVDKLFFHEAPKGPPPGATAGAASGRAP